MDKNNRKIWAVLGVLLFAGLLVFWGIDKTPLSNHESFVSVTARQMLQSGDWTVPRFNDHIRLQKTPLNYWMVAGAAAVFGQVDEFTTRLPSAVLAVLSVGAILYFVSGQINFSTAAIAALLWSGMMGYLRYGQSGRPEMSLCSFVTIAMLSFYSGITAEDKNKSRIYILIFWVSFALGMLAKGPAPAALVLPAIFCWFVFAKKLKSFKKAMPITGTLFFLLIVLPWPVMVVLRSPAAAEIWQREFFGRFLGTHAADGKSPWYYLGILFSFAAPFCAIVPYALMIPFYKVWGSRRPVMWYMWLWVVVQVAVMTISGGKREHYILPVFPGIAILGAMVINDFLFELKAFKPKDAKVFFAAHLIVILAGAIGLVYWAAGVKQGFIIESVHLAMMGITAAAIVVILAMQKKKIAATAIFFAGYCAILMAAQFYFIIPMSSKTEAKDFSLKVKQIVPADEKLIAYEYVSEKTVHYAGRKIPVIDDIEKVYSQYLDGAWVFATRESFEKISSDTRFNIAYKDQAAEINRGKAIAGGLMHKE